MLISNKKKLKINTQTHIHVIKLPHIVKKILFSENTVDYLNYWWFSFGSFKMNTKSMSSHNFFSRDEIAIMVDGLTLLTILNRATISLTINRVTVQITTLFFDSYHIFPSFLFLFLSQKKIIKLHTLYC